jgi:exonuclease VII small subunit
MVKKMKSIADAEPSLDEALEKHQKATEQVKLMEQVIASKHKNLQEIINRLNKED